MKEKMFFEGFFIRVSSLFYWEDGRRCNNGTEERFPNAVGGEISKRA
jgi:hypothetical protein